MVGLEMLLPLLCRFFGNQGNQLGVERLVRPVVGRGLQVLLEIDKYAFRAQSDGFEQSGECRVLGVAGRRGGGRGGGRRVGSIRNNLGIGRIGEMPAVQGIGLE